MELKKILENALLKIKPDKNEEEKLKKETEDFCMMLERALKKHKARADIFLGGSLAKNTIIKKKKYDADIFLRFDSSYSEEQMNSLFSRICSSINLKGQKIHGSRDYFRFQSRKMFFEVVPVFRIQKPEQARNTTDLSYFHVAYILKQLKKNKKLSDEIILAKAFAYASDSYGAESHIQGFSGYSLEILVSHYKSFLNFVKSIAKSKERLILDPASHYKNKYEILDEINESKIEGPAILIDPTFKERNALAALSISTYDKFRRSCQEFLKNPSLNLFEKKKINEAKMRKQAKNKKAEFLKLEAETEKQEGSIAGAKLLKFYNFLEYRLEKYFDIIQKEFQYDDEKTALFFFVLKKKPFLLFPGPPAYSGENSDRFKKKHKNVYEKEGKLFAKEKNPVNIKDIRKFFSHDTLRNMSIKEIRKI